MRRVVITLLILLQLAACATHPQHEAAVKRSIDAVVVDETQRQKVLQAISAGKTPEEALAEVSDGPKNEKPIPN